MTLHEKSSINACGRNFACAKSLSLSGSLIAMVIVLSAKLCILLLTIAILTTAALATKGVYTVNVTNSKDLGQYMTNETFFTLYYFLNDTPGNGISQCYGKCAETWPPFYVEDLNVNPALNLDDFTVISRDDGTKQLAYKGWPLYLYIRDTKAYETNGQGVNDVWFVINPQDFPPSS
jgi:predicted lipoprotein with Yx(FWY)xxD motif